MKRMTASLYGGNGRNMLFSQPNIYSNIYRKKLPDISKKTYRNNGSKMLYLAQHKRGNIHSEKPLIIKKNFYVCSYGGCGSKLLCSALEKYGNVTHIHSRKPPNNLEYVGNEKGGNTYFEWFNGVTIPDNELENYYVIYIYRNPSFAIQSRFTDKYGYDQHKDHLEHIQTDVTIKLDDVLASGKDLYKIREFYNNYVKVNKNRNYKIYCINYEDMFNKQDELSSLFGIGKLNMINFSKRKDSNKKLDNIYADLIEEMNNNAFITIS